MSRVDTILELTRLKESQLVSSAEVTSIISNIFSDQQTEVSTQLLSYYKSDMIDWYLSLTKKRVYSTLKLVAAKEVDSLPIILKAFSSLLTQLFIRLEKNSKFPINLFYVDEILELIKLAVVTKTYDEEYTAQLAFKILSTIELFKPEEEE